mgnify:CR=1 FL=1
MLDLPVASMRQHKSSNIGSCMIQHHVTKRTISSREHDAKDEATINHNVRTMESGTCEYVSSIQRSPHRSIKWYVVEREAFLCCGILFWIHLAGK